MFYTHPCSVISARWVPDNHLRFQLKMAGAMLSGGIELHTVTPLTNGYEPLLNHWGHWARRYDVALWLLEYYTTLSDIVNDVFHVKHTHYKFIQECKAYIPMLKGVFVEPRIDWLPPSCHLDSPLESYRAFLLASHPVYRRVRPPLWWDRRLTSTDNVLH